MLKDFGCATTDPGARWCEVSRIGRNMPRGWVSARYLSRVNPGDDGPATQLPGATPVPPSAGPSATGRINCTSSGGINFELCDFSVYHRGGGNGTLSVRMPNGNGRRIDLNAGRPVSSNSIAGIYAEWSGDTMTIFIGTNERYIVPDAVIWGG
jgi:hypothetical protein